MIHSSDLDAILERAQRADGFRVSGAYADLGVIASVVREDVPALVARVRELELLLVETAGRCDHSRRFDEIRREILARAGIEARS